MSKLIIYKASAGSGKTYTLTREYLKLVYDNPLKFRNILAVTFTNKATWEMKQRILMELKGLTENGDPDLEKYFLNTFGFTGKQLKETSNEILERILHNYSRFHVETIDKFFQRVIRSFAREVNLPAGYNIELDDNWIREEAVNRLLSDAEKDKFLLEWLVRFAETKVMEGQHWNLKKDILRFSEEIFKEKFRESSNILIKQLGNRENINNYLNSLYKYTRWFENYVKELGYNALNIMHESGLTPDDFHNKEKGPGGFLKKLSNGIVPEMKDHIRNCWNNKETWYAKSSGLITEIQFAYESGLNKILGEVIRFYDQYYFSYNAIGFTRPFIYSLGILTDISKRISDCLNERNIFLLADASFFLREIIGNNETPFIYEKMGNYFHHFMIDEFQDTSRMQWFNFLPLLENSLAQNHINFVVGDVKQSIYRWRNSDWEILSEGITRDFRNESVVVKTLTENRRSRENIVSFNNQLFTFCREILGQKFSGKENSKNGGENFREKLLSAYSDVIQVVPPGQQKEGGYVEVSFLETDEGKTWEEKSEEKVIRAIMMLQDLGYEPCEIAILVRKVEEGKRIAHLLQENKNQGVEKTSYRFDLISNELLYLEGSSSVRLILGIMKFLVDPDDNINKAQILNEYKRYLDSENFNGDPHDLFQIAGTGSTEEFSGFMPDGFAHFSAELPYLSLNEVVQRIISLFGLYKKSQELSYMYAFQDIILEYSKNELPDIGSFLKWWKEFGSQKSLSTSDEQNAIRIMTIHKAKGLQFRAVIIPYCNWNLDHTKQTILWCTPGIAPFNELALIPVRYSPELEETIFREDYFKEWFRVHIDNLNLLYVALTRAMDHLLIMAPFEPGKYQNLNKISDLIGLALSTEQKENNLSSSFNMETLTWKLGEPRQLKQEDKPKPSTEFISETASNLTSRTKLRTRWHGTDFLASGTDRGINQGKFIHEVLQSMVTADDLDRTVDRVFREGKISSREIIDIRKEISDFLSMEPVKNWFTGDWKIMKERDIITVGGHMKRPDRVMIKDSRVLVIDYKSGLTKQQHHNKQMREYIDLVKEIGYQDVKGYLCYIRLKEIIQITV